MIIWLVKNANGAVVSAFINEEKAKRMAESFDGGHTSPINVQDAQSSPVRG